MSTITELIHQTEQLRQQAETLRRELDTLRAHLEEMAAGSNGASEPTLKPSNDCLGVALSLAQDLGPDFSSERPHDLADRDAGGFDTP